MNKVKLRNIFDVLAMTDGQISAEIAQMTGQRITSDLITRAANGDPISAIHADAICKWLSQQLGKDVTPSDFSDLRIHAFTTLPDAADTEESAAVRTEKINGFVAGFNLAYAARANHQTLSNKEVYELAEQATSKRMKVFTESAGQPAVSRDAFYHSCAFAANGVTVVFESAKGARLFQELRAMDKEQREQYARNMARSYLQYL